MLYYKEELKLIVRRFTLSTVVFLAINTYLITGGDIVQINKPIVEVHNVVNTDVGLYLGLGYSALNE